MNGVILACFLALGLPVVVSVLCVFMDAVLPGTFEKQDERED